MLSKAQIKYIQSFHRKKYRDRYEMYLVEGEKIVREYLTQHSLIHSIYATSQWLDKYRSFITGNKIELHKVEVDDLQKISALKTPNQVLALAKIPHIDSFSLRSVTTGLYLALDHIQDPGNLGTIIRTADWFGLDTIICSTGCVEAYNSKVVQASMGSLSRITVYYADLSSFLKDIALPIYATTLAGRNIFTEKLPHDAIVIIGNESQGISSNLVKLATDQISIPKFGKAESLNAAIATGIALAQFSVGR